jgi:hypothetical protein
LIKHTFVRPKEAKQAETGGNVPKTKKNGLKKYMFYRQGLITFYFWAGRREGNVILRYNKETKYYEENEEEMMKNRGRQGGGREGGGCVV